MNAVAKTETVDQAMTVPQEGATLLSVISRAAADPQVDVEKMERLMAMYERIESRRAETAFAADLAQMQPELPSVGERGNAAGRYTYALWEDINTAIKPVLQRFGFALTFRTDFTDGIAVTGVLSHRDGHSERTTIRLPADKSGNKNDVQAVASSVSYGKRYTAGALLNLTSHGEDDDAYRAGGGDEDETAMQLVAKRNEWLQAITECEDAERLAALKDECIGAYGMSDKVPADVRRAFVQRKKELQQ